MFSFDDENDGTLVEFNDEIELNETDIES